MVDPTSLNLWGPAAAGYIYIRQTTGRPASKLRGHSITIDESSSRTCEYVLAALGCRQDRGATAVARYTYTVEYTEQHPPCTEYIHIRVPCRVLHLRS